MATLTGKETKVLEQLFFILGLVNNVFLIVIFVVRGTKERAAVERIGRWYLLLAIPAIYGVILAIRRQAAQVGVFLGITVAYLALEWAYDYWLKIPWRRNWKLATPYLCLYYAMNYGFVVMPWQASLPRGLLMLGLFAAQIVANIATHKRAARLSE